MPPVCSDGMRLDMARGEKAEQNKEAAPTGPITETVKARGGEKKHAHASQNLKKSAPVEQNWLPSTFLRQAAVYCSPRGRPLATQHPVNASPDWLRQPRLTPASMTLLYYLTF